MHNEKYIIIVYAKMAILPVYRLVRKIMNYSWQRQLIIETIQKTKEHMTAAQIYQLTRKSCPHLSLGTVYRNLNLLVETGKLRRIGCRGSRPF